MRWAPTSSFERRNQELLALSIRRNTTVFVVHKGSLKVPGVPGAYLGRLRNVPGGSQGRVQGSQGRPLSSQGRAQGIPGIPGGSGDVSGIPGILFTKMIPEYNSIISFRNLIP